MSAVPAAGAPAGVPAGTGVGAGVPAGAGQQQQPDIGERTTSLTFTCFDHMIAAETQLMGRLDYDYRSAVPSLAGMYVQLTDKLCQLHVAEISSRAVNRQFQLIFFSASFAIAVLVAALSSISGSPTTSIINITVEEIATAAAGGTNGIVTINVTHPNDSAVDVVVSWIPVFVFLFFEAIFLPSQLGFISSHRHAMKTTQARTALFLERTLREALEQLVRSWLEYRNAAGLDVIPSPNFEAPAQVHGRLRAAFEKLHKDHRRLVNVHLPTVLLLKDEMDADLETAKTRIDALKDCRSVCKVFSTGVHCRYADDHFTDALRKRLAGEQYQQTGVLLTRINVDGGT